MNHCSHSRTVSSAILPIGNASDSLSMMMAIVNSLSLCSLWAGLGKTADHIVVMARLFHEGKVCHMDAHSYSACYLHGRSADPFGCMLVPDDHTGLA